MDPLELLRKEIKNKSNGIVAKELGVSKATISLVRRNKYPNPQNIYQKIKEKYGDKQEIIGVETTMSAFDILQELENGS
jgi:hypothetical protein